MEKILVELNKKLVAANKREDMSNKYKDLRTDEERVVFTLNIMSEYNIIPEINRDKKSAKLSVWYREQGNNVFVSTPLKNTTCIEALQLYTKSISHAPYPSQLLALAYANRSAVLIKLHLYELCIRDIDLALSSSYPDNLRAKLYIRKIECLTQLKSSNLKDTVEEAQSWLEKMSLEDSNKKKLKDKLESIKKISAPKTARKGNVKKQALLPKIKTYNTEVPCASDAVAIAYNEEYGRHVVATRKISPGEVITIEKPYSWLLTPDNMYTHCSNCLEVSWANIPCDYCTSAMYCSEECKAIDWKKFHDIECTVFSSMLKMGMQKIDLLSLRLAIQAVREAANMEELRNELKEVDSWSDPRTKGFSKNGTFLSDKYRSILSLVTNTEKRSVRDLFRRSLDASFILYFLATCSNMFGRPLEEDLSVLMNNADVTFVGGLIMRHQQMIPSNVHSFSEERGVEVAERGIAAMPFLSLMNHSCNPKISRTSRPKHMIAYVLYSIEKGEQIFDCYAQHYAMIPKAERQEKLLSQYYFKCNCITCQEDWPLYVNLKSFNSLLQSRGDKMKVNHALRKFNRYVDLAMEGNISDKHMVDDLLRMIEVLCSVVPMNCMELTNVVETLKRIYDLCGNQFVVPEL